MLTNIGQSYKYPCQSYIEIKYNLSAQ